MHARACFLVDSMLFKCLFGCLYSYSIVTLGLWKLHIVIYDLGLIWIFLIFIDLFVIREWVIWRWIILQMIYMIHGMLWTWESVADICLYDGMTSDLKLWTVDPMSQGSKAFFAKLVKSYALFELCIILVWTIGPKQMRWAPNGFLGVLVLRVRYLICSSLKLMSIS